MNVKCDSRGLIHLRGRPRIRSGMKALERGIRRYFVGFVATPIMLSSVVMAQEDSLVSTSKGSFSVSITLNESAETEVQISGLRDVFFEKDVGAGALSDETMDLCIYMSEGTTYGVTITAGPLINSDQRFYPYSVSVSQGLSNSGSGTLDIDEMEVSQTIQSFRASSNDSCLQNPTLKLTVKDRDTGDFGSAFTATATVLIEVFPE